MRTTIGFASFVALSAATATVGANNLFGSDTLKKVTEDVLVQCNTLSAGATNSLVYLGTGSGNGQAALINNAQQIAPMSRMINASCTAASEGIVLALDGLSIVSTSGNVAACSPGGVSGDDCSKATDPSTGLTYSVKALALAGAPACAADADCAAFSTTAGGPTVCDTFSAVPSNVCVYKIGGGGLDATTSWKDALRLVYGGASNTAGTATANRNCNSLVRKTLVNTWGNFFENNCAVGGCTQLQHAFRRDDESGTTDAFVGAIGITSTNFQTNVTAFCNDLQADVNNITTQACAKDADCASWKCNTTSLLCQMPVIKPNYNEFQDQDPVRRTCIGTGNLPGPPTGTLGGPPPSAPTEQVCNRDGTLGVVLPVNPPPAEGGGPTNAQAYPQKDCAKGKFAFYPGAKQPNVGLSPRFERCPNGDTAVFGGLCLTPIALDGDPGCINGKNNLSSFKFDTANAIATDGRVYNLIVRKGGLAADAGNILTIKRPDPPNFLLTGAEISAELIGAFYRIHTTRTALVAPSTTGVCHTFDDATQQIGCLVAANPCSIGYAGNEAASIPGAAAMKVNALEATDSCVRALILGGSVSAGTAYPISRKLYVNSIDGFETLPVQSPASPNSELELAKCFSNNNLIHSIVKDRGFTTIGDITGVMCNADADCVAPATCNLATGTCTGAAAGSVSQGGVFCESCQSASTSPSCADNPAGITSAIQSTRPNIP